MTDKLANDLKLYTSNESLKCIGGCLSQFPKIMQLLTKVWIKYSLKILVRLGIYFSSLMIISRVWICSEKIDFYFLNDLATTSIGQSDEIEYLGVKLTEGELGKDPDLTPVPLAEPKELFAPSP